MRGGERGAVTTELVLLTPVFVALLLLLGYTGRLEAARSDVVNAARDAARAASIERGPDAATQAAEAAAQEALEASGVTCDTFQVLVGVGDFEPGGTVTVEVRCGIPLRDLGLLGIRGTRTATATSVEVIDEFRSQ